MRRHAFLVALCLVSPLHLVAADLPFAFWTESPATKVFTDSPPGSSRAIDLAAARGEWESAQIVFRAGGDGMRVTIELGTPLVGPDGAAIPDSAIELRRVAYVPVPYLKKSFPDPLLPLAGPLALERDVNAPVLVTIRVPRDAEPGEYRGNLRVRAAATGESAHAATPVATIPVALKVWGFEIPPKPSVRTAFGISLDLALHFEGIAPGTAEARAMHERYYEMLVSHRISPYELPVDVLDPEAARFAEDPRVTDFSIPYRDDLAWMKARVDRARERGWLPKAYFYPWDEPVSKEQYEQLKACVARLRSIDPKLRVVSPFYRDPDAGGSAYDALEGLVTMWCSVSAYFKPDRMEEKRRAGGEVWWYVCCGPGSPYANLHLTMDGMDHRILPWQMVKYRIEGFLYWSTTYWNSKHLKHPYLDMVTVPDINKNLSGDGSLLYPGRLPEGTRVADGPVASLRLELLRDGFEDLEYCAALERRAGRGAAGEVVGKVVTDLSHYCKDPAELELARRALAAAIEGR